MFHLVITNRKRLQTLSHYCNYCFNNLLYALYYLIYILILIMNIISIITLNNELLLLSVSYCYYHVIKKITFINV